MIRVTIEQCLLNDILNRIGMTQVQLSDLTGLSKSQISDYANNRRRMSLKNAKLIAYATSCHIDDLYHFEISQ